MKPLISSLQKLTAISFVIWDFSVYFCKLLLPQQHLGSDVELKVLGETLAGSK